MPSTTWSVLIIGLWVVVVFLLVAVAGLARRLGQASGVRLPQPGPEQALANLPQIGTKIPLADLPADSRSTDRVVLFLSSTCGPCIHVAAELKARMPFDGDLAAVGVTVVTDQADAELETAGVSVVLDPEAALRARLGVAATPTGIAVDSDGRLKAVDIPNSFGDVTALARAIAPARTNGQLTVMSAS